MIMENKKYTTLLFDADMTLFDFARAEKDARAGLCPPYGHKDQVGRCAGCRFAYSPQRKILPLLAYVRPAGVSIGLAAAPQVAALLTANPFRANL